MMMTLISLFFLFPAALPTAYGSSISSPFQSVHEAGAKINILAQELAQKGDRRSLFPQIYTLTIQATEQALDRGEFTHPEWTRKLVVNYANIYRRTILKELTNQSSHLARGWQLEFNNVKNPNWNPDLDVVLGINVHIRRDLVEALFVTPTVYDDPGIEHDFFLISETLRQAMPEIWNVYLSYSERLHFPSFLEESVMISWIQYLRRNAWYDAQGGASQNHMGQLRILAEIDQRETEKARSRGVWLPLIN